jgi:hypothetical protein
MKFNGVWLAEDFYVYASEQIEFTIDIRPIIAQRVLEPVSCMIKSSCLHSRYPNSNAPLGTPLFYDDFVVFRNTILGREIYEQWKDGKNISLIIGERGIIPSLLHPDLVIRHVDPLEKPVIVWGVV